MLQKIESLEDRLLFPLKQLNENDSVTLQSNTQVKEIEISAKPLPTIPVMDNMLVTAIVYGGVSVITIIALSYFVSVLFKSMGEFWEITNHKNKKK